MKTIDQLTKDITPLPWSYINSRTLIHVETDMENPSGAGLPVCSIPKKRESDAAYIVKACNSLPKLVEALDRIAQGQFANSLTAHDQVAALREVARAVLKEVLG